MPRRKQQNYSDDEDDYFGSVEYGMDDYDDPIDHMTPEEINQLAEYISMIQGGKAGDDFIDDDYEEPMHYVPPSDNLYPGEFDNDSDDDN